MSLESFRMRKQRKIAAFPTDRAPELRAELARKITEFMGPAEDKATSIPGVSLHRRIAPTPPCRTTYHPGVIVIAQGRKQVNLGRNSFIYDASRFLVTAIDLPTVARVAEATKETPCLALTIKLDMSVVREILGREEIHVAESPSGTPAMSTAVTTPEFLRAGCRLVDLLTSPQDIPFLGGLILREIIYRVLCGPAGARLRAIATLGDQSHR